MADPNITKLHTLPWPALAGISLLLHASAIISVGLPWVLRVGAPADSGSVNIPVTLVDDAAAPVAALQNSPRQTAPQNLPQQTVPLSEEVAPQPTPMGGTNATVEPSVSQTQLSAEKPASQPDLPAEKPTSPPDKPEPIPTPDNVSDPAQEPLPESPLPESPPPESPSPENQFPADGGSGTDAEPANGPIVFFIIWFL